MSLIYAAAGARLPSPWASALLVYWKADSESRLFPHSPFEMIHASGKPSTLVIASIAQREARELPTSGAAALEVAMDFLFHPGVAGSGQRVVSIHAKSMLGRLARWHAIKTGKPLPAGLLPENLTDLVDAVNEPAVLAFSSRVAFRVSDYVDVMGLEPEPGFDRDTGLLVNMLTRYGR